MRLDRSLPTSIAGCLAGSEATGTPEQLARIAESYTGQYLAQYLGRISPPKRKRA